MKYLRAKELPEFILRRFGDNLSPRTICRMRRVEGLRVPCTDDDVEAWYPRALVRYYYDTRAKCATHPPEPFH